MIYLSVLLHFHLSFQGFIHQSFIYTRISHFYTISLSLTRWLLGVHQRQGENTRMPRVSQGGFGQLCFSAAILYSHNEKENFRKIPQKSQLLKCWLLSSWKCSVSAKAPGLLHHMQPLQGQHLSRINIKQKAAQRRKYIWNKMKNYFNLKKSVNIHLNIINKCCSSSIYNSLIMPILSSYNSGFSRSSVTLFPMSFSWNVCSSLGTSLFWS